MANDPAADGRDILAGLAARGIHVQLGSDGRPYVGPRQLMDDSDRVLLETHRSEVLAALNRVSPGQGTPAA